MQNLTLTKHIVVLVVLALLQSCTCQKYVTPEDEQITLLANGELVNFVLMDQEKLGVLPGTGLLAQKQYWVATTDDVQIVLNTDYGYHFKILVASKKRGSVLGPGLHKGKHSLFLGDELAHEYDLDQAKVTVDRLDELNYPRMVERDTGYPYWWWGKDYEIPVDLVLDTKGYQYDGEDFYVSAGGFSAVNNYIPLYFEGDPKVTGLRLRYDIPFALDQDQYRILYSTKFEARTRNCEFVLAIPGTP